MTIPLPLEDAVISLYKYVTMAEWISQLEQMDSSDQEKAVSRPAVKILDFFRGVEDREGVTVTKEISFSTEQAKKSSQLLYTLKPIQNK